MVADAASIEVVRALINRYFVAIDDRDFETIARCFADDAVAVYGGERLPVGSAAITAELRSRMARLGRTMHMAGTSVIDVAGDRASAETYAIAYATDPGAAGAAQMRVRGLRYSDRFERRADGWRIVERSHTLVWATELSAQLP